MMNLYDHRFATYEGATGMTIPAVTDEQHDDPNYEPLPRYWVAATDVDAALTNHRTDTYLLGRRDIARATDSRTFVTSVIPASAVGNKLPLALAGGAFAIFPLLGVCSSLAFDYSARNKMSGASANFFIVEQFACPPPSTFEAVPEWLDRPLSAWLAPRVVELSYTSHAMAGFAREAGDDGRPFRWLPPRRQQIRAEIDAAMFHFYGLDRDEVEHVLDSFQVLNKYDMAAYGDHRTRGEVLRYYDAMAHAAESGVPYVSSIDPAPGLGQRHESGAGR